MNTKLHKTNIINKLNYQSLNNRNVISDNVIENKVFSLDERTEIVIEAQSSEISIESICAREGILLSVFYQWTQEFLRKTSIDSNSNVSVEKEFSDEEKFSIVIEGTSGVSSIAEICRREDITQDIFLEWIYEGIKGRKSLSKVRNFDNPHTEFQIEFSSCGEG